MALPNSDTDYDCNKGNCTHTYKNFFRRSHPILNRGNKDTLIDDPSARSETVYGIRRLKVSSESRLAWRHTEHRDNPVENGFCGDERGPSGPAAIIDNRAAVSGTKMTQLAGGYRVYKIWPKAGSI
jgi:hypothetical protein